MGKFERDWVEIAEQNVAKALNNENSNIYSQEIASIIDQKLKELSIDYDEAKWSGGADYGDAGDINILKDGKVILGIELKFSKKDGEGTKANLGQNKFHEYIPEIIGYQKFDEDLGLKNQRYEKVEKYLNEKIKNKTDYENKLRQIRKKDTQFIDEIAEIAKIGQEKYAQYISENGVKYLDKINELVEDILHSKHVKKSNSTKKVLYCVIKQYETPNQNVKFVNFDEIDNKVCDIQATGKSIFFYNQNNKLILKFSVNWKNICQGGATPSFNVFMG